MIIERLENYNRHDIINLLDGNNILGVELGIAAGIFSERMLSTGKFASYVGVDMYTDRGHDIEEYKTAIRRNGIFSNYKILKMSFDDALDLFDDESIDFLYIDGYAHTGQNDGKTLSDWYPKVKTGGLFAGDDYNKKKWPKVVKEVNAFLETHGYDKVYITDTREKTSYCKHPSWAVKKK